MKGDTMIKFLNVLIVGIFIAAGCNNPSKTGNNQNPTEGQSAPDMHNARIALDYAGSYTGTLPCADCEGIETTIVITYEGEYKLQTLYKGKGDKIFEKSGTYSWNDAGNTITLDGIELAPNQYFVGENVLIQLDMEGNRIAGELGERYVLRKKE